MKGDSKMELLKTIKPLDWLILVVAVLILVQMNFSHLMVEDVLYLTAIIMWSGGLLVRLYLQSRKLNSRK